MGSHVLWITTCTGLFLQTHFWNSKQLGLTNPKSAFSLLAFSQVDYAEHNVGSLVEVSSEILRHLTGSVSSKFLWQFQVLWAAVAVQDMFMCCIPMVTKFSLWQSFMPWSCSVYGLEPHTFLFLTRNLCSNNCKLHSGVVAICVTSTLNVYTNGTPMSCLCRCN